MNSNSYMPNISPCNGSNENKSIELDIYPPIKKKTVPNITTANLSPVLTPIRKKQRSLKKSGFGIFSSLEKPQYTLDYTLDKVSNFMKGDIEEEYCKVK